MFSVFSQLFSLNNKAIKTRQINDKYDCGQKKSGLTEAISPGITILPRLR